MSLHKGNHSGAHGAPQRPVALERVREEAGQPATVDGRETAPRPHGSRRRTAIALVAALVVALVLGAAAYALLPAEMKAGIRDGLRDATVAEPR